MKEYCCAWFLWEGKGKGKEKDKAGLNILYINIFRSNEISTFGHKVQK